MKKILLLIICLFIFPFYVNAEEYRISELGIKINIPSNYVVVTRDNYKNNREMEVLGVTPEYMEQVFDSYNAYLDAFDLSIGKEIFIIVNSVPADYSNYSKSELEALLPTLKSHYESLGSSSVEVSVVELNGINYFMIDYYQGGYYLVNYYLVSQNKGYNFQIQSSTALTDADKADYRKIIETVSFGNDDAEENPPVIDDEEKTKVDDNKTGNTSKNNSMLWIIIGASVGVFVGVIIGLIVSSKKKSNKCLICGIELNKDIKFCPKCGTKK